MSLNMAIPLRNALVADTGAGGVAPLLGVWEGEPAVFTRRPAPQDAPYPLAQVSPDIAILDIDGLVSRRPVVMRDITIYGRLGEPGADQYRIVETAAYRVRALFHRLPAALTVPGHQVIGITCAGPTEAPTDAHNLVARMVALTIQLREVA